MATGDYNNLDNKCEISIDECIPTIELCKKANDARAFGVISEIEDVSERRCFKLGTIEMLMKKKKDDIRVIVNSVGEGGIWVSNANGNFQNGDLICCSKVPGYGMKQADDIIRSYTVAKITCDCDFELDCDGHDELKTNRWKPLIRTVIHNNTFYKVAFVGCVYKF